MQVLIGMSGPIHAAGHGVGVARWAHIGSFVAGFVLVRWMDTDYFERRVPCDS